ncbi:CHAT domain-containing protein [Streptomyces sp. NPDC056353]|uniref:CHAT domain-containing protein n=1 Tax=Streptomyces salinarius TaxID=2762598 RepID=A0ABW8B8F3_9ACTN|nr:CHAT domain-containing protein [Streptomyces sp. BSE6.1]
MHDSAPHGEQELVAASLRTLRESWFESLCWKLVTSLSSESQAALARVRDDLGAQGLVRALVVAKIAELDGRVSSGLDIVRHLQRSGVFGTRLGRDEDLWLLSGEVRLRLRSGTLPGVWHHNPERLASLLLEYWAVCRADLVGSTQTIEELAVYWAVTDPRLGVEWCALPRDPFKGFTGYPPRPESEDPASRAALVLTSSDRFKEYAQKRLSRLPEWFGEPYHVVKIAEQIEKVNWVDSWVAEARRTVSPDGWERFNLTALQDASHSARLALRSVFENLTPSEVCSLIPRTQDQVFLDRCLEKFFAHERIQEWALDDLPGPHGPEDETEPRIPDWIRNRVLHGGIRTWHGHHGPIPWWWFVLENERDVIDFRHAVQAGAVAAARSGAPGQVDLLVPDRHERLAPLSMPIRYNLDSTREVMQLLQALEAQCLRLDVMALRDDGRIRLLHSLPIRVDTTGMEQDRDAAMRILRDRTGGDPDALYGLLEKEPDSDSLTAFLSSERAKAEDLMVRLESAPSTGSVSSQIAEARTYVDQLRAYRADFGPTAQAATETAFAEAIDRLWVLRQQAGLFPTVPSRADNSSPDRWLPLMDALSDDRQAFVHISLEAGYPAVQWALRRNSRVHTGLVHVPDARMDALHKAADLWTRRPEAWGGVDREPAQLLDLVQRLLTQIAGPIVRQLTAHGVQHVIISPAGLFELWPLHAVPVSPEDDAPTLDQCFASVTYAPSLTALRAMARRPRPEARVPSVAAAYDPGNLGAVESEALAVTRLHPGGQILTGSAATPSRFLEQAREAAYVTVSCHSSQADDPWQTSLRLADDEDTDGRLTMARIRADGTFDKALLVVLSACSTGTRLEHRPSPPDPRTLESACLAAGARTVASSAWEIADLPALVFTTLLHAHIAGGSSIPVSFRNALDYLRHARWLSNKAENEENVIRAASVLDAVRPGWRAQLAEGPEPGLTYSHPYYWSGFKLTGLVETPPPADR